MNGIKAKQADATEARKYLSHVVGTETGRKILSQMGYEAVIEAPTKGDDASTIKLADAVHAAWSLLSRDPLAQNERYKTAEDKAYDRRMARYAEYAAYRRKAGLSVPDRAEYGSNLTTKEIDACR